MAVVTNILSILTVVANIITVLFLLDLVLAKTKLKGYSKVWNYFSKHAVLSGFIVSLTAMLGSLYFSDVLGYEPCLLCWYQRIFMYSQVFLFGTALWKNEKFDVWKYSFTLTIIGTLVAIYHYYIQMATKPILPLPCEAVGYSASCTETFITTYGYITIPMMALSAFVLLLVIRSIARRN